MPTFTIHNPSFHPQGAYFLNDASLTWSTLDQSKLLADTIWFGRVQLDEPFAIVYNGVKKTSVPLIQRFQNENGEVFVTQSATSQWIHHFVCSTRRQQSVRRVEGAVLKLKSGNQRLSYVQAETNRSKHFIIIQVEPHENRTVGWH